MIRFDRTFNSIASGILVVLVTVIVFDTALYCLAPPSIVRQFESYQTGLQILDSSEHIIFNGYFVVHEERGFEQAPHRTGFFSVDGLRMSAWSNSLGCFDREWELVPDGYYYFAGDSFTWAFAPYEAKFPTRFEALTGIPTLKCGVSHTGQRQQFSKFKEIVGKLRRYPKRVVVGYYYNDAANDYAYPHSTVVDGQLVTTVFLDRDMNLIRLPAEDVEAKTRQAVRDWRISNERQRTRNRAVIWLRTYSLTAHIAHRVFDAARTWLARRPNTAESNERGLINLYGLAERQMAGGAPLRYRDFEWAGPNKRAVTEWKAHALEHGYELFFVLIPPASHYVDKMFYTELRAFLVETEIPYLDLTLEFHRRHLSAQTLYWRHDLHFSARGNELVADILASVIQR